MWSNFVQSPLVLVHDAPAWRAAFAWSAERGDPGLAVRTFRRVVELDHVPASVRLHVSADSRYRLWLNGNPIGFGPAKGTLARYHFDTYELGSLLVPGRNVLAAEVRWFGVNAPLSEVHSPVPGLLVQSEPPIGFETPEGWRVRIDRSVSPDTTSYIDNAQLFLNHMEQVDLREQPVGWQDPLFDDSDWQAAESTGPAAATESRWGVAPLRTLVPRDLPAMHESEDRFTRAVRNHAVVSNPFDSQPAGWSIPPGEGATLLLDAGGYVTAFPILEGIGGEGREIRITYAEALGRWVTTARGRVWRKSGVRDDVAHDEPHGYRDTITLRPGAFRWEPFYWRAFRWVRIEVMPGPAPVTLTDLRYRLCVHPQRCQASVDASDPQAKQIFDVSVRTYRMGAHEIYDDSPYFEQLSYIADARMELLGSLHLCNDVSLPRRTLRLHLDTLRADGLIDARVPCQYARQTIPYFCLHWIFMVRDYWHWTGVHDAAFVRECLVAVDTILTFFRSRLRPDGFVGPTGGWNMVDDAREWPDGQPPAVSSGGSTYLTCLFIEALDVAVQLHEGAGEPVDAHRWRTLVRQLRPRVRAAAWAADAGVFLEGPEHRDDHLSQHTQAAAINADVATRAQTRRILKRLCDDDRLIRTKSMQSYYLARALEKAGRFDLWHSHVLQSWRTALVNQVTTWPEYPDPSRSDSHAWAAWPAVDYVTTVLGIRPGAPGWTRILLAPQVNGLDWARGSAPSPHGGIHVAWERTAGELTLHAETPAGIPVDMALPGGHRQTFVDGGVLDVRIPLAGKKRTRRTAAGRTG